MNQYNEVLDVVIETISSLLGDKQIEIKQTSRLADISMNSLNFINLVVKLETKFEIEFDDEHLIIDRFENVEDFAKYIFQVLSDKH